MYADNCCTYRESFKDGKQIYTFTGPCVVTGKSYSVAVDGEQLYAYRRGKKIQDAFPTISADDREFLMSGISPEGWKQTFKNEEE